MTAARFGVATDDWDSAVHALGGHFLQSTAWQRVQAALGQPVMHARSEQWAWSGPLRTGRFPRYLYVPYGPAAVLIDDALQNLERSAREQHLDFVRLEPLEAANEAALRRAGARQVDPVQPRWTWVLDITPGEDDLRRGLSAGHRGSVNAAGRRGIHTRSSSDPADIEILLDLQRRSHAAGGFPGQTPRYHRAEAEVLMPLGAATLYVAEHDGTAIASALCFDWFDTRYYAHAASDPLLGRRLGAAAPLVWRMILDARTAGRRAFDFWGVAPDPGRHPAWAGFSRFKMAFGGSLVERAGTWELPLHRLRHRVYGMVRRRS